MSKRRQRVTIKMIAEASGISIGTVDRALNDRTGISKARKQQILEIAQELGYKPNMVASALSRRKELRIGVAFPYQSVDFYNQMEAGVNQAAAEYENYGVTVEKIRFETSNAQVMYERLSELDISAYDGLVINTAGGPVNDFIDRCVEAGVATSTFNTDAPETKRLFYVGANSHVSGMMGGELMGLLLKGKGNVAVLGNFARVSPFIDRFSGFCEFVQKSYPDIHFYPCPETKSDSAVAAQVLKDTLARVPEINGVFATGYTNTVGAAQALEDIGRKDVALVGYDLSGRTGLAVQQGWCRALLYQDPRQQGYLAVQSLARHLLEGWTPPKPKIFLESQVVFSSNLDGYLEKEGIAI